MNVQGLRPTTDRNKETLFNWLMAHTQDSRCLDVFAGSGGLGFEALSRYAKHVTFIELDKNVARNLQQNLITLKATEDSAKVLCGDALGYLKQLNDEFDLLFLDPPFNQSLVPKAIEAAHCIEHFVFRIQYKSNHLWRANHPVQCPQWL